MRSHRWQPTRLPRPSLGFSRQEHWSGLPFPSPMHESEKWKWSRSVVSDSSQPHGLQPTRLLHPWDFPGKSTGVGCHCLLLSKLEITQMIISWWVNKQIVVHLYSEILLTKRKEWIPDNVPQHGWIQLCYAVWRRRQEEKGTTGDEMVGWHHWRNGHEFEQAPGDGEGQGSLACCSPWSRRVGQDWASEQQKCSMKESVLNRL